MIELTPEQAQAVEEARDALLFVDPRTNTAYVLIRQEVYERLKDLYDDSPWTDEEMDLLHEEAAEMADHFGKQPSVSTAQTGPCAGFPTQEDLAAKSAQS